MTHVLGRIEYEVNLELRKHAALKLDSAIEYLKHGHGIYPLAIVIGPQADWEARQILLDALVKTCATPFC
ncbi:MAG: hypothetical protein JWQ87_5478 [Candidatus Sulfotelmatobacter sp.]|nr:hypothetical protein [Candidatus Sulfotelmatobacter sp.]